MKKIISFILISAIIVSCAILLISCSEKPNTEDPVTPDTDTEEKGPDYKYVCLIGVDGGGRFFTEENTPLTLKIFENGATAFDTLTELPSGSGPNWMSILHGISYDTHLRNNAECGEPIDSSYPYPSIFRVIREQIPDAKLYAHGDWAESVTGTVEMDINCGIVAGVNDDIVSYLSNALLKREIPTMLFIQFDKMDGNWFTPLYTENFNVIDKYIYSLYQLYDDWGVLDETLFIVTADHGGGWWEDIQEYNHGRDSYDECHVFLGIAGRTVNNYTMTDTRNRDIPAIVAAALGLEAPDVWTAKIPEGLFGD